LHNSSVKGNISTECAVRPSSIRVSAISEEGIANVTLSFRNRMDAKIIEIRKVLPVPYLGNTIYCCFFLLFVFMAIIISSIESILIIINCYLLPWPMETIGKNRQTDRNLFLYK